MKAIKKIATITVMAGVLFSASGFTAEPASVTDHGDVATVSVQVPGGAFPKNKAGSTTLRLCPSVIPPASISRTLDFRCLPGRFHFPAGQTQVLLPDAHMLSQCTGRP